MKCLLDLRDSCTCITHASGVSRQEAEGQNPFRSGTDTQGVFQLSRVEVLQVVKIEEAKVQEKAAAAKAIKDECEAELSVAMPILQVCRLYIHCMNRMTALALVLRPKRRLSTM